MNISRSKFVFIVWFNILVVVILTCFIKIKTILSKTFDMKDLDNTSMFSVLKSTIKRLVDLVTYLKCILEACTYETQHAELQGKLCPIVKRDKLDIKHCVKNEVEEESI